MKKNLSAIFFLLVLSFSITTITHAEPVTIAVAPFKVSSESGLEYLKTGIIDLFSSRLAVDTKVVVLDKVRTLEAFNGLESITEAVAVEKAKELKADFLLYGNLSESPKGIQLESFLVGAESETPMLTFSENSSKYESSNVILLLVNRISKDIKRSALKLNVPEERKVKPVTESGNIHAHPDTLLDNLEIKEEEGFLF